MSFFFFNDTATTEIYTLSLHDALPISRALDDAHDQRLELRVVADGEERHRLIISDGRQEVNRRSEEHTSELQSRQYLVCRLLLVKQKKPLNRNHGLRKQTARHLSSRRA